MAPKSSMMDDQLPPTEPLIRPGPVAIESIRVEDKIYSARQLADLHPGGSLFIKVDIGEPNWFTAVQCFPPLMKIS